MLSKTDVEQLESRSPTGAQHRATSLLTRKIWLPRLIYDGLPYFYLTAGIAAFFATLYITEWFWVLPHYILFSAACVHLAAAVMRKRRRRDEPPAQLDRE